MPSFTSCPLPKKTHTRVSESVCHWAGLANAVRYLPPIETKKREGFSQRSVVEGRRMTLSQLLLTKLVTSKSTSRVEDAKGRKLARTRRMHKLQRGGPDSVE